MIEKRPIGEDLDEKERKKLYPTIVAGVAWPSKQQGYAVVLGCARESLYKPWKAYVIDQYQSADIYDLVHQCCVLDLKWEPERWMGDADNDAAFETVTQVNRRFTDRNTRWMGLRLTPPIMLEFKRPYEYILSQVNSYLHPDRMRLYLKNSLVNALMMNFKVQGAKDKHISEMQFGYCPHVEALAFAVVEIFRLNEDKHTERRHAVRRSPMRC